METFEDLKNIWNRQPDPHAGLDTVELIGKAEQYAKTIKVKHWWTISILAITVLVLAGWFSSVASFTISQAFAGFSLMVFSLMFRVLMEYVSFRKFEKNRMDAAHNEYALKMIGFYKWRMNVHRVCTPVSLMAYAVGFVLLLPDFKKVFSHGFYVYIIVSGSVFFVVFSWMIYKEARKEIRQLDFLKNLNLAALQN
jgi:hypothetical protein